MVVLIQKEYNYPYISNLIVTGTLSLAIKEKALIKNKNNRIRRI